MSSLPICILETGTSHPKLVAQYGRYSQMIQAWLQPALPEAQFDVLPVFEGAKLDLHNHPYRGFIITGSPHGVYEDLPWINYLQQLLRDLAAQGHPLFGICFGHQIMAAAFGGIVTKSEKGWGIGIQEYHFTPDNLPDAQVLVYHQDQVTTLPPEAQVIGFSTHCAYGALDYPFAARSIQFHPEFSQEFVAALIRFRNDPIPDQAQQLQALQEQQIDNSRYAQWVADFLRQGQKKTKSLKD